jgi:hypothetical protein
VAPGQIRTLHVLNARSPGASFEAQLADVKHAGAAGSSV